LTDGSYKFDEYLGIRGDTFVVLNTVSIKTKCKIAYYKIKLYLWICISWMVVLFSFKIISHQYRKRSQKNTLYVYFI